MVRAKEFQVCIDSVKEMIGLYRNRDDGFSTKELGKKVVEAGGVLRVSAESSLRDYLDSLVERDILYHNGFDDNYHVKL